MSDEVGSPLGGRQQSGVGFSHGSTLDATPAPLNKGAAGSVHSVSDLLTQSFRFADPRDLADLRTFATRAKIHRRRRHPASGRGLSPGRVRVRAAAPAAGRSDPHHPGAAHHGAGGTVRPRTSPSRLSAVLDRLARAGEDDVELPVPPSTVTESWTGVGAPRTGWELVRSVPDAELRQAAEAGIAEVAGIVPDKPGALIVNNARAAVWGRAAGRFGAAGRSRVRRPDPGVPWRRRPEALPRRPLVPPHRRPRPCPGPDRHRTGLSLWPAHGSPAC